MNILELTISHAGIWSAFVNLMGEIINLIFRALHHFDIDNAALCIIIFTILIKAIMIPMNIKQQKFSRLSSRMQPELQAIQKKYAGKSRTDQDAMRKQSMEMNELYEKYGVSPTGGCLPLLITMPIIFALYRVIYNIPTHIDFIGNLYKNIADSIMNVDGYEEIMTDIASGMKRVNVSGDVDTVSEVINVLSNMKTEQWSELKEAFPACADVISTNSDKIIDINRFLFGLNISDWPTTKMFPGLIIPILALIVQWVQTKQISSNNNNTIDKSNPTAQSMLMMTKIMPFFSAFICLSLPIGVGIYWIVSGLFQIIQQFFVNKHMDKIDLDELIEKNREKARKKKIKMGLDPNASFAQIAQENRKSISSYAKGNNKNTKANDDKQTENEDNNVKKSYKKGSISAYANMNFKNDNK